MATIYSYPASRVEQLRRAAPRVDIRLPETAGWSTCSVDPMKVVEVFAPLRVRPGWTLRAYQWASPLGGNAMVWAVPADSPFREPGDYIGISPLFGQGPVPDGALRDFREVIEGDGSPWCYLQASILARELWEFGALAQGCSWSTHVLVTRELLDATGADKRLDGPPPVSWEPTVTCDTGLVTVRFHTWSELGHKALYQVTDTYPASRGYRFSARRDILTTLGVGYTL